MPLSPSFRLSTLGPHGTRIDGDAYVPPPPATPKKRARDELPAQRVSSISGRSVTKPAKLRN